MTVMKTLPFLDMIGFKRATHVNKWSDHYGKMKSNQASIVVKIEKQEAKIPELGRVQMLPNQGTTGDIDSHQDTKPMVHLPGALQNPMTLLEQSSQTRSRKFILPLVLQDSHNIRAMNRRQVGGDSVRPMHQQFLPVPPGFNFQIQNLNQFSIHNQPSSKTSWLMPSTQLSLGTPNQVTNRPVEESFAMHVTSSNRESKLKMVARSPFGNEYPNMINTHHSTALNYQVTPPNISFSLPSVYGYQGQIHQAERRTELQKPQNEINRRGFAHLDETLSGLPPSSSSSGPYRRHLNTSLYSIRNKASDYHVDPILRAFAVSMKEKNKNSRKAGNRRNIPNRKKDSVQEPGCNERAV